MNTAQLAQLLARRLTVGDLALLPGPAVLDIVMAMNSGLQDFYRMLPRQFRRTTISETLRAPEQVAVQFPSQYSNMTLGAPFTAAMRGCTVLVSGDTQQNEVAGPNAVLDQFLGTQLSTLATVYHDAVSLPLVIESMSGDVLLFSDQQTWVLTRMDVWRWQPRYRRIGRPWHYQVDPVGMSQGAQLSALLRVHPMPDRDYRIRFEAEVSPAKLSVADVISAPLDLPVPVRFESLLEPICARYLVPSLYFADSPMVRKSIGDEAQAAESALKGIDGDVGAGGYFVGTPTGF